jgi:zinc ribbon protein
MQEGHRFCGLCGYELKPTARFCGNCGHSVSENASQAAAAGSAADPPAGPPQAPQPDLPAYFPTITAGPGVPVQPLGASDVSAGAATANVPTQGRPPPAQAPASARPSPRGTAARPARLLAFRWSLALALTVLVAAGGTAAGLLLTRHSHAQPGAQGNAVAVSSPIRTTASPSPTGTTASPTPSPPPTQVNSQGVTIGIGAVNTDPDVHDVTATLAAYFGGIDIRNYMQAWDAYAPALQAAFPFQSFSGDLSTTQDSQVVVQSIQHEPNGDIDATVSFQSHQAAQDGPNGETCTNWSLDYQLVPSSTAQPSAAASSSVTSPGPASLSYLISKAAKVGAGNTSC